MEKKDKNKLKIPIEKPKKILERTVLLVSVISCIVLFTFVYFNKDNPYSVANSLMKTLRGSLGEINYNLNCTLVENKNTAYCQEKRAKIQSDWRSVTIMGNKGSKFRLNKK